MDFASWDQGLRPNELEHHGIPGMKWGVRRYQNRDGSLTSAGEKRYGSTSGLNSASAKRMTKDFNRLDQGYANAERRRHLNAYKARKYALKMNRGSNNKKKLQKYTEKAREYGLKAREANKQKAAIENLQWKILAKAAQKGYTTNSEAVTRIGKVGRDKVKSFFASSGYGTAISGQNVSIKKYGSGGTNVINYRAAKSEGVQRILQEERDRERARQLASVRR